MQTFGPNILPAGAVTCGGRYNPPREDSPMATKTARPAKSRKLAVTKDTLRTLSPTKQAQAVKGGAYTALCGTSIGGKTVVTSQKNWTC